MKTDLREPDVQYVHPVFSAGEREMKTLSKMERNEPDREYKIPEPHRLITENKKMRTAV